MRQGEIPPKTLRNLVGKDVYAEPHPISSMSKRFKKTKTAGPLTTKERNALPDADFAVPSKRAYPIDTAARARDALSRVSHNGTSEEQKMVCEAVAKRWPAMHEKYCQLHKA